MRIPPLCSISLLRVLMLVSFDGSRRTNDNIAADDEDDDNADDDAGNNVRLPC